MKIPKKIPEKAAKRLCEIIRDVDIVLQHTLKRTVIYRRQNPSNIHDFIDYLEHYDFPGYVNRKKNCVYLAHKWDNMGETLIHEGVHLLFPEMNEPNVETLTDPFWNNPEVRKIAQQRIVEALHKYDL